MGDHTGIAPTQEFDTDTEPRKLFLADKTAGFELARASFHGLSQECRVLTGLVAGGAVKRLIGARMVHSDRQQRCRRTAAGTNQSDHQH